MRRCRRRRLMVPLRRRAVETGRAAVRVGHGGRCRSRQGRHGRPVSSPRRPHPATGVSLRSSDEVAAHNGRRGDRNGSSRIAPMPRGSGPATRPNMVVGRHHRVAGQRAHVLRGALRDVLHDPLGRRPRLWAEQTAEAQRPVRHGQHAWSSSSSSVTCQIGVFAAERGQPARTGTLLQRQGWGMREWYVLTFLMGAFFIGGQIYEYAEPRPARALTLSSDRLRLGLLPDDRLPRPARHRRPDRLPASCSAAPSPPGASRHAQATGAIVISYYWHFVDVVWIALFATIYLLKYAGRRSSPTADPIHVRRGSTRERTRPPARRHPGAIADRCCCSGAAGHRRRSTRCCAPTTAGAAPRRPTARRRRRRARSCSWPTAPPATA